MLNKPNLHDPFTKKLALCFLIATFIMIVFPPYHQTHPKMTGDVFFGYHPIAVSQWKESRGVSIDYGRLILQEIGLTVICGAIYIWKKA